MKVVKKRCKSAVWTCICIFFGNAIIAFAIAAFVMPHGLIMGGATGLSILINRVLRSDIAVVVLSLNLLALLLGYVVLGKKFLIAARTCAEDPGHYSPDGRSAVGLTVGGRTDRDCCWNGNACWRFHGRHRCFEPCSSQMVPSPSLCFRLSGGYHDSGRTGHILRS